MGSRKRGRERAPKVERFCIHCGAMIRAEGELQKWLLSILTSVSCIECQPDGGWPIE